MDALCGPRFNRHVSTFSRQRVCACVMGMWATVVVLLLVWVEDVVHYYMDPVKCIANHFCLGQWIIFIGMYGTWRVVAISIVLTSLQRAKSFCLSLYYLCLILDFKLFSDFVNNDSHPLLSLLHLTKDERWRKFCVTWYITTRASLFELWNWQMTTVCKQGWIQGSSNLPLRSA